MNPSFASPLPSDPTQDSVSRDFKHVIAVKREAEGQALILLNNLRKGEDILLGFGRAEFFVTHPVLAHGASWIKGLVV
ncbi:hypothetical protein HHX47_DHR2000943 [Lentinula edodes]|nr:hypothetical protein HHX47_DHR2000943 [Lentinula edodes]